MNNLVKLNGDNYFGEGNCQKCYIHPNNERLCIKISKRNSVCYGLDNEIEYWSRYNKKRISEYQFFAKYYGITQTNLGSGYIFDLIKDETTGEISKSLEYYLLNSTDSISDELLETAFEKLIRLMANYKIIAIDLKASNICVRILKNNTVQLILVDGLGHRDFIPLVDWSSFFAKRKIERRLNRINLLGLDRHRSFLREQKKKRE